ncbi:33147_t:CDS:2, partial [Racocetra persica]
EHNSCTFFQNYFIGVSMAFEVIESIPYSLVGRLSQINLLISLAVSRMPTR